MKIRKTCSFPSCTEEMYARDLCLQHYRQDWRGEPPRPVRRRSRYSGCSFAGCARPHRASKLCSSHYRQRQRGVALRPLATVEKAPVCKFPDCNKPRLSLGWCAGHYSQYRQGRLMAALVRHDPGRDCGVSECGAKHEARDLCKRHYKLRNLYRLTTPELVDLMSRPVCDSCGRPWGQGRGRERVIDHDATTRRVRGVLCGNCNVGLGHFGHEPDRLRGGADYLERGGGPRHGGDEPGGEPEPEDPGDGPEPIPA